VGWRDRDWGKFDEAEWESFVGPTTPPHRRTSQTSALVVVAAALSLAGMVFFHATRVDRIRIHAPSNVVRINWTAADRAPASRAGRICVTNHEKICAAYVAGERPADVLTRQLELDGFSVR
jgi:hypothetical protein